MAASPAAISSFVAEGHEPHQSSSIGFEVVARQCSDGKTAFGRIEQSVVGLDVSGGWPVDDGFADQSRIAAGSSVAHCRACASF